MAAIDDTALGVAAVYARALLDLANQQNAVGELRSDFDELVSLMDQQPDFAVYMTSEAIDQDRRKETLEQLFRGRLSDLLLDTLLVMNGKARSSLVRDVHAKLRQLLEEQERRVEASVTTAVPLDDAQRQQVIETIEHRTGKQVQLSERVEPAILGGMIVEVGDQMLDSSLASRLRGLEKMMHDRASQEVLAIRESAVIGD